jgi:hypothetical protein
MDDYVDPMMLELERVAIGQPVPRSEDPVLLRGEGITPTTLSLPGQALHARFVPPSDVAGYASDGGRRDDHAMVAD